jgi:hypothetical protein
VWLWRKLPSIVIKKIIKWIATKLAGQEPIKYLAGKKKNDKPN